MTEAQTPLRKLAIQPLTPDRWDDLTTLFGVHGACGGCWCMWWRLPAKEYEIGKGAANKGLFQDIVLSGEVPGLLAYIGDTPAGWLALAPRSTYRRMERMRVTKPVDDLPVWSVTCFFVAKNFRRQGVTTALLHAAIDFARERGAHMLEGYPVDTQGESKVDTFAFFGIASAFRSIGFIEVARNTPTRPIMRLAIEEA